MPSPRSSSPVIVGRVFHSRWSGHLGGPYPSRMSTDAHLLLADGQEHDVAEWEKLPPRCCARPAASATTTPTTPSGPSSHSTLDGIEVTPLGTPALVADLPDPVRPPARGDGWDVRALLADPDAEASHAAALTDLENGATSLLVQVGASGIDVADLATVLKGVLLDVAPVVLDAPSDPLGAAPAFAELAERHDARCRDEPRGGPGGCVVRAWFRDARRRWLRRPPRRSRARAGSSAAGRWSSTGPRCTTSVPPTCRSSATCSRSVRTTCARSTPPASRSTTPPGWSSSGWRPATSSS